MKRLSFAWWNTALSPDGRPRANDEQKAIALALLNRLLTDFDVDFIALGEVCDEDVRFFKQHLVEGFSVQGSNLDFSSPRFHTCFICRDCKLIVIDLMKRVAGNLRISQRVDLGIIDTDELMHVFISHWPSGLWREDEQIFSERHQLGVRLRDAVDEVFSNIPP